MEWLCLKTRKLMCLRERRKHVNRCKSKGERGMGAMAYHCRRFDRIHRRPSPFFGVWAFGDGRRSVRIHFCVILRLPGVR